MDPQSEKYTAEKYTARTNAFAMLKDAVYIHTLPSYGNKIFYGLGFLALTSLALLAGTGIIMATMGQVWWLTSSWGIFVRSIHLWSVEALMAILLLHALVGFTTSAFKPPRRMIWAFGAAIGCLALIQTEFGYGLRGDFSSQFRAVSGADFWNGSYLGSILNPLNHDQIFALHIAVIPLAMLLLFIAHYLLVHTFGIAKPYRDDIRYTMVAADHAIMYRRGAALAALIIVLAFFFPSPYVKAIRIEDLAVENRTLVMATMASEFDHTSDTATYMDSIDPYTFDTRQVYIIVPYQQLAQQLASASSSPNALEVFAAAPSTMQDQYIAQAKQYFSSGSTSSLATTTVAGNPVIAMIDTLMEAAKNGLYTAVLDQENLASNDTYTLRFLNDMHVFEDKAKELNMATAEWGMMKDETGSMTTLPPGSWWFAPIGMINSSFDLLDNPNGDRDAAWILGFIMLLFIAFPYIPYLNRVPELLHLAPFVWKEREINGKRE